MKEVSVIDVNSLSGKILDKYSNGVREGYEIGFKCAKGKLSIKSGFYSKWYGPPESGKTTVILCVCAYLAKKYNKKFAVYSPEEGLNEDLAIILLEIWTGKPFYQDGKEVKRMTELEASRATNEVAQHFYPIRGRPNGFDGLIDAVKRGEAETGQTFWGIIADPLNTLIGNSTNIAGAYEEGLMTLLDYLQQTQKHCFMGTHPTNPKDTVKEVNGMTRLRPTNPWELKGGQTLWGMGFLMVSVHRFKAGDPNQIEARLEEGDTYKGNEVMLLVQKAKPKGIGESGSSFLLRYDVDRSNYYEKLEDGSFRFNVDIGEKTEYVQSKLEPNNGFDDDLPF